MNVVVNKTDPHLTVTTIYDILVSNSHSSPVYKCFLLTDTYWQTYIFNALKTLQNSGSCRASMLQFIGLFQDPGLCSYKLFFQCISNGKPKHIERGLFKYENLYIDFPRKLSLLLLLVLKSVIYFFSDEIFLYSFIFFLILLFIFLFILLPALR